jgi:carboxylesterase type B
MLIDLWPDNLGDASGRAPAAILKEQARHLENKTNSMITGRIEPSFLPKVTVMEKFGSDEDLFMYEFHLEAPVLDYYRNNLFTIFHGIDLYPVIVHTDDDAIKNELSGNVFHFTADNEEELLDILKKIFNSNKAVTIINSLLAQVKEIV